MSSPDKGDIPSPIKPIEVLRDVSASSDVKRFPGGFIDKIAGHSLSEIGSSLTQAVRELSPDSDELSKRLNDGTLVELNLSDKIITARSSGRNHSIFMGLSLSSPDEITEYPMGARFVNKNHLLANSDNIPASAYDILPNEELYANGVKWLCKTVLEWNQTSQSI